jgi:DNA (cytosine-5)-methyltransferase 1
VFVVGYLGDWRVAAAVLFERESLQGNPKPSRKKRQEVTSDAERSVGETGSWRDGSQVAGTLTKQNANGAQRMPDKDNFGAILQPTIIDRAAFSQGPNAQYEPRIEAGETMSTLIAQGPHAVAQPIAVDTYNYTTNDHTTQTIRTKSNTEHIGAVLQPIAVDVYNQSIDGQTSATITEAVGGTNTSGPKVMHSMAIRRLTPKECERLQGFPDDWTKIPYRNKPADQCPDGPRYKACGNSMAVPVMRWIGKRIKLIESML